MFVSTGVITTALRTFARAGALWLAASAVPAALFNPLDWTGFVSMFSSLALLLAPVMGMHVLYALGTRLVRWRASDDAGEGWRERGPAESGVHEHPRINPGTGLPCIGGSTLDASGRTLGQGYDD